MHINLNDTRKSIPDLVFEYSKEFNVVYVSTISKSRVEVISKQLAERQLKKDNLPGPKRQIYQRVLEIFKEHGK